MSIMSASSTPDFRQPSQGGIQESGERNDLKDGTYYQAEVGVQAKRAQFFSALNSTYAEAVHLDAANIEYSEEEEFSSRMEANAMIPEGRQTEDR
ncbi:hypothetical protein D9615_003358 [Tricholomella constricta]|uniref:Uncharacterized protein n=1 Tax=Tricholomella constricta TaxID=117010 RepID=A0A8H5M861_9AGAR|nr:hypothetical protein D9615_003358 [Tricholomella constricta]